jgi:transcriptional regulator MraZ
VIPFLGKYRYAVDEKGRFNVPSKHRDALKGQPSPHLVVMKGLDGCLTLLPLSAWRNLQGSMTQAEFNPEREDRLFERLLIEDGDVQVPDAQGRIQLSKELRAAAKIEREVLIFGVGSRIEIWAPDEFDAYMAAGRRFAGSLEEMAKDYFRRRGPSSARTQEDR